MIKNTLQARKIIDYVCMNAHLKILIRTVVTLSETLKTAVNNLTLSVYDTAQKLGTICIADKI